MRNLTIILAVGTLAGGCKWTEFDDLENSTWVDSTGKPNSDSADYAVAIARGLKQSSVGGGGRLVVFGAGQAQFTELIFASTGGSELATTALKLNTQFGIGNLDPQPILLEDPTSDEVSLVVNSGGQSIAVLTGSGGLLAHQIFGPSQPDAAAYMIGPSAAAGHVGEPLPSQPIVASVDSVYGTYYMNTPNPQPKTTLMDAGVPLLIRAVGAARLTQTMTDDLVVWSSTGKLLLYDGRSGWDPALATASPLAGSVAVDTGFAPGKGSQIIMVDGTHALLVGHHDIGDTASFLGFYDVGAMDATPARHPAVIGAPITLPDLRTATILDLGAGGRFVVAGYPTATVNGVGGGRVMAFPLSMTAGLDVTPAITLFDSQPESDQVFGRTVAAMSFNGHPIIVVGADNEVFTYYRTAIYDETRQGR